MHTINDVRTCPDLCPRRTHVNNSIRSTDSNSVDDDLPEPIRKEAASVNSGISVNFYDKYNYKKK